MSPERSRLLIANFIYASYFPAASTNQRAPLINQSCSVLHP